MTSVSPSALLVPPQYCASMFIPPLISGGRTVLWGARKIRELDFKNLQEKKGWF